MYEAINRLPAATWNHMGVNQAEASAALPQVPAGGWPKQTVQMAPLPDHVTLASTLPAKCAGITSGMDAAADGWIKAHANTTSFFLVDGVSEKPIQRTTLLTKDQPVEVAHQAIYAKRGSSLTVIQTLRSTEGTDGISASLTQIYAEAGATVRLIQVQLLEDASRRWGAVGIETEEGAKVELIRAELGASLSVCGSRARLAGRNSAYTLNALYFGDHEQCLDYNDVAQHLGRETKSNLHTAGVLQGNSKKILRGTIDFCRGCVHAAGHESEDVLLFSPSAQNRTAPLILCHEEQVEGQHAATVGRLDENKLYYLQSRGLSLLQARRLMVQARFAPVLDAIPDDALKEEIMAYMERRINPNEILNG